MARAHLLVLGHLEDGVDGFLLGGVNETAGVDYKHIGLIGMRSEFMPPRGELAHHHFAVYKIFGATETDKTDFQMGLNFKDIRGFADIF